MDTTSKFSAAASAAGYLFQARLPDEDQAAVHKLFEVLNDYCKSLAPRMQVIVCDHVELLDLWFRASIVQRWRDGIALVPPNWPDRAAA